MTEFNEWLLKLARDGERHGRFLNTLSLLEYIGARKILKSQHEDDISMELLSHACEELRHARVFKRLAQDVAGRAFDGYGEKDVYRGTEARDYFKAVDGAVHERFEDPSACYRLTTLLVEERVMRIYPSYEEILGSLGFGGRIRGILKEEEKHLRDIESRQARNADCPKAILGELRGRETEAFNALFSALSEGM